MITLLATLTLSLFCSSQVAAGEKLDRSGFIPADNIFYVSCGDNNRAWVYLREADIVMAGPDPVITLKPDIRYKAPHYFPQSVDLPHRVAQVVTGGLECHIPTVLSLNFQGAWSHW